VLNLKVKLYNDQILIMLRILQGQINVTTWGPICFPYYSAGQRTV